jgi:hypothetical protein
MDAAMELLGGNDGSWREGTMGERLDEVGREIGEDLDGGGRE